MTVPEIAVGALVYNDAGEILLAKSHKWSHKWVVLGGHVDAGETLHECVKREVKEETNLDVDCVEWVDNQESIYSDIFHKKRHFVFIDYSCKAVSSEILLNDELQEHQWIQPEKALEELDLSPSTRLFIKNFLKKK